MLIGTKLKKPMNALELYKFVNSNDLEFHYTNDDKDVILFIPIYHLEEFNKMLKNSSILDEGGVVCNMKAGYFCFMMEDITAHFDIELKDIFNKEDEK